MKNILSTLLFSLIFTIGFSQTHMAFPGHCKKADIEIITGETLPEKHVIIRMNSFPKSEIAGTIEDLTKKQIKTMKTAAKWSNACKVFIAFEPIQTFKDFDPGAEYYKDKVCYYVIVPMRKIEMVGGS